jgi:hypothetical protein
VEGTPRKGLSTSWDAPKRSAGENELSGANEALVDENGEQALVRQRTDVTTILNRNDLNIRNLLSATPGQLEHDIKTVTQDFFFQRFTPTRAEVLSPLSQIRDKLLPRLSLVGVYR